MENFIPLDIWQKCIDILHDEIQLHQFNTWIRPLKVMVDDHSVCLLAPNRFVLEWVRDKYLGRIEEILDELTSGSPPSIALGVTTSKPSFIKRNSDTLFKNNEKDKDKNKDKELESLGNIKKPTKVVSKKEEVEKKEAKDLKSIDFESIALKNPLLFEKKSKEKREKNDKVHAKEKGITGNDSNAFPSNLKNNSVFIEKNKNKKENKEIKEDKKKVGTLAPNKNSKKSKTEKTKNSERIKYQSSLNKIFTFSSFIEGKSNQLAVAAAKELVESPGIVYNPLFLYGGVGLGKTHLMQAVGNYLVKHHNTNVVYLHSERFVADMVKALQLNAINDFKRYYRSVDALLIDDIQFFSGKKRSQEEFFHTFNALLEGGQQIILTCDCYPQEIAGLEERLKSRFGWGLTVAVEPPELETRVAILMKKAEQAKVSLPKDAALFIAQRLRSNVRELEGALKRVIASAQFLNTQINIHLIKDALRDLLALHDKVITTSAIQRAVAEYYQIKVTDIFSKEKARTITRPRQMSMALSKELTNNSLPEIGESHGGRDHSTVLHACRRIKSLLKSDKEVAKDYKYLVNLLTH